MPYIKLLPLCIARIAEGMIYSVIFPYINEMILSFGVNENDVGVWSAIAVSILQPRSDEAILPASAANQVGVCAYGHRSCTGSTIRSDG